ncbi:MAG: hypothetical protein ACI30W_01360 [Muribaculaceae bacterium]
MLITSNNVSDSIRTIGAIADSARQLYVELLATMACIISMKARDAEYGEQQKIIEERTEVVNDALQKLNALLVNEDLGAVKIKTAEILNAWRRQENT